MHYLVRLIEKWDSDFDLDNIKYIMYATLLL